VSLVYLYCLLPAEAEVALEGLTAMEAERPVRLLPAGKLQAAVSDVGEDFAEASLNTRVRDLEWLSPRAVRHHDVIDRLYQQCPELLPLTFGAIFHSEASLRERLLAQERELSGRLDALRGKQEWDLRLSRDEETFREKLSGHSEALRQLETDMAGKPPGTRFLLERKAQNLAAREAQRVGAEIREEVHATLSTDALDAHKDPLLTPAESPRTRLELRSAYLVEAGGAAKLQATAEALAARYADLGYRLELTGPWPAFSFAGGLREALS